MEKKFISRSMFLLLVSILFINLTAFTNSSKKWCTAYLHVKNNSTTRSIIRLTLVTPGGNYSFPVNIPPGGSLDPAPFGNFLGNVTLSATLSPTGTTAGTVSFNLGDYDGTPVACNNFTGRIASGSFYANSCFHFFATIIDNGSFCND